ncbi:MAG: ABC transporter substrate-binding protein [Chloroflexi bacterium]|nr:ABC transporter substrate-binding protein [Chloroflexota bacterium]
MRNIRLVLTSASISALIAVLLLTASPTSAVMNGGILRLPFGDPSTLDPAVVGGFTGYWGYELALQVFDGLVQLDANSNVLPAIASSWIASPDARVFTFTLRNDVYFHNGRQVTSADFVYSWNRAIAQSGANGYTYLTSSIYAFTAPLNFTFVVTLTQSQSSFLSIAALPLFSVIPSESAGTIGTQPIGTGAFKFVSWTHGAGGKIVLQANPNYFGGVPYLAGVEYKYSPTTSAQWADFQANNLDVTRIPTSTWDSVKTDPNVITQTNMYMRGLGIDTVAFPDVNVRRAFQQSIDRAGMVNDPLITVYTGTRPIAYGAVSPGMGAYDNSDISIAFNPTNALALLAAAGWTDTNADGILDNGAGTNLTILLYGINNRVRQRLVNDLSNIGGSGVGASVTVTTNQSAPGIKMFMDLWVSEYPDPADDLSGYYTSQYYASETHYNSAAFNSFYNAGLTSIDPATRNAAFHAADSQIVITDAIRLPIFYSTATPMMKKSYVKGLQRSTWSGYPMLKSVWLDLNFLHLPLVLR